MLTERDNQDSLALVADIGGTNARLAIADLSTCTIKEKKTFQAKDHQNLEEVFTSFRHQHQHHWPRKACVAIACPVEGDELNFTNSHWSLSIKKVKQQIAIERFHVINDFVAQAMAIPVLEQQQLITIGGGGHQSRPQFPKAILGPGTGLGIGALTFFEGRPIPTATEGGHTDFSINQPRDIEIWRFLHSKFGHVSNERILSGPGIINLFEALHHITQTPYEPATTEEICQQAVSQTNPIAVQSLDLFFSILGSVAGNLALTLGALGGVYISGGIVPRYLPQLEASSFRQSFEDKGRFQAYLKPIPTYAITAPDVGLLGAANQMKYL